MLAFKKIPRICVYRTYICIYIYIFIYIYLGYQSFDLILKLKSIRTFTMCWFLYLFFTHLHGLWCIFACSLASNLLTRHESTDMRSIYQCDPTQDKYILCLSSHHHPSHASRCMIMQRSQTKAAKKQRRRHSSRSAGRVICPSSRPANTFEHKQKLPGRCMMMMMHSLISNYIYMAHSFLLTPA